MPGGDGGSPTIGLELGRGKEACDVTVDVRARTEDNITLGTALRKLREQRTNFSARALSLHAGLSESYVGKVEAGQTEPSFRTFAKIAVALRMKPGEVWVLLTRESQK